MSERETRFRYRLDPLARLRAAQAESARAAAARAAAEVEACASECAAAAQRVQSTSQGMREGARRGETIRLEELLRLRAYLQRVLEEQAARERELEEARRTQACLLETLQALRREEEALGRHRTRLEGEFVGRQQRAAANRADERWLTRRRGV
jgi:hypothetical protein